MVNLRILDPACGSGSFLLGAYTYLLNYHRDWYVENNPEKHTKKIYQGRGGQWFLTIAEKKKILLNSIYGVDIDSQAVEVTKLSLLLKVLEDENQETLRLFPERALPDLGNNIKCGNSLIGPDFFDNPDIDSSDDELRRKINPFDWKTEFPQIFKTKNPGFDTVIGNPPWVQSKFMDAVEKRYYEERFFSMKKQFDIFNGFVEKGATLLKQNGEFGFIIPNRFLMNIDYVLFRQFLLENVTINEIADVGEHIFAGVEMPALLFFFSNRTSTPKSRIKVKVNVKNLSTNKFDSYLVDQVRFKREPRMLFTIYDREETNKVWKKIERSSKQLRVFVRNARGVEIGKRSELVSNNPDDNTVKFLVGEDIGRYTIKGKHYLRLGVKGINYKAPELYQGEKILIRKTGTGINSVYDADGYYVIQVIYIFKPKQILPSCLYLLGILNSRLMAEYYFSKFGERGKKAFPHLRQGAILDLPIRTINFDNSDDKAKHDKMVKLVDRMLDLHKKLAKAKVPAEKTHLQRQINSTDKQIDNLVYELYNLTQEEIKIVEGK